MQKLRAENGQALIEFALILPILLLIMLGVIEFGQAFNYQNDLTNMANQAIRYAEVNSCGACGASKVETYIPTTADVPSLKSATACFSSPYAAPAAGQQITVKISSTFNWLSYLGLGASTKITSTVTGRLDVPYKNNGSDAYTLSNSCP